MSGRDGDGRIEAKEGRASFARLRRPPVFRSLHSRSSREGFTLLELMIVISIIIILAMIALAQYNQTVLAAREATLRHDLSEMNKLIDQYAADKGKLPESLDALVGAGYITEIPVDPITGAADWQTESGDNPVGDGQGITRVRSASTDTASDGRPYSEW